MLFTACADIDIWPLAWIGVVPALWAIEGAPTRRHALLYGWLAGLVANLGGFYWISGLLTRFANMPLPLGILGWSLLCGYQAIVFLAFAWAVRSVRQHSAQRLGAPLPMALVAPIAMVGFEMVVPFIFPWYLAITQAWVTPVIQIAELTGPVGVTALLMAVNGAIFDLALSPRRRPAALAAAAVAVIVAACLGFGLWRIDRMRAARAAAPGAMIGVVQGNIAFDEKGVNRRELAARQLADQQARTVALEAGAIAGVDRFGAPLATPRGAELVLWTESSYPYALPRSLTAPGGGGTDLPPDRLAHIKRGFQVPLVFGAITRTDRADDYPYNSALMLDRAGRFVGRFDKIFLLIFGEYIPGLETFPFVRDLLPNSASHFHRGTEIVTFPFEHAGVSYRLGPMICYEDILPDFGRKLARHHPHLLVNLTNDAWFGDSAEPWEHLALSVYRAVETRADLVRAVNTGVSAFIDAAGAVYYNGYAMDPGVKDHGACEADAACHGGYSCYSGRCRPHGADAFLAEVALLGGDAGTGHTFYARFGDVFGWFDVLVLAGMWIVWPRVGRNRAR
jgi:apolipoprotein N-acyltransferase